MAERSQVVVEAQKIIDSGKYSYGQFRGDGYKDDNLMDCSEFVYTSYVNAGFANFPTKNTHAMAASFESPAAPEAGDIVYWSMGHVAIIEDPEKGTFLGAQSTKSGLRRDNYKAGWWSTQSGRKFLRYSE